VTAGAILGSTLCVLQMSMLKLDDAFSPVLASACSPAVALVLAVPLLFSSTPLYPLAALLLFPLALAATVVGPILHWAALGYLVARHRCLFTVAAILYYVVLAGMLLFWGRYGYDAERPGGASARSVLTATVSLVLLGNVLMWAAYLRFRKPTLATATAR
jgi:hypothetical protein